MLGVGVRMLMGVGGLMTVRVAFTVGMRMGRSIGMGVLAVLMSAMRIVFGGVRRMRMRFVAVRLMGMRRCFAVCVLVSASGSLRPKDVDLGSGQPTAHHLALL